jgi:hypothetical protein
LHEQKVEGSLKVVAYGAWRRWSVDRPPLDNAFDVASGASRDEKVKRHSYP